MKKSSILISLLVASNIYAGSMSFGDFGNIGNSVSKIDTGSLGNLGNYSDLISSDGLKNFGMNILEQNKSNIISSVSSILLNQTGGAFNGVSGSVLSYCYDYKPTPIKSFDFSLNPCAYFKDEYSLNPCDLAPDLSSVGYTKKKANDITLNPDLKKYCDSFWGNDEVESKTTQQVLKDINTNKNVKKSISNSYNDKETTSTKYSDTSLAFKKAQEEENKFAYNTIASNDYKAFKVMKDSIDTSESEKTNVDFTKIDIAYDTLDDYEDSIKELATTYTTNLTSINLTKLKREAYNQFLKVNTETSDTAEQIKQKEAIKGEILDQFNKLVDLQIIAEIDKAEYLEIDTSEMVVHPTKDVLRNYDTKDKYNVIYQAEKQKKQLADIKSRINAKYSDLKEKAIDVVEIALVHSQPFNREAEYNAIMSQLK